MIYLNFRTRAIAPAITKTPSRVPNNHSNPAFIILEIKIPATNIPAVPAPTIPKAFIIDIFTLHRLCGR